MMSSEGPPFYSCLGPPTLNPPLRVIMKFKVQWESVIEICGIEIQTYQVYAAIYIYKLTVGLDVQNVLKNLSITWVFLCPSLDVALSHLRSSCVWNKSGDKWMRPWVLLHLMHLFKNQHVNPWMFSKHFDEFACLVWFHPDNLIYLQWFDYKQTQTSVQRDLMSR